jgi:preprotein translocase subunit SecG
MSWLQTVLLVIHSILSISIIAFVLLQRGKGADAGAGFGSGASGTVFGARGSSTFFSKTTAVLATCFFITSLWLAYLASSGPAKPKSLLDEVPATQTPAPATNVLPELPTAPAPQPPAGGAPSP